MEPHQSLSSGGLGMIDLWPPACSGPCAGPSKGHTWVHQLLAAAAWVCSSRTSVLASHGSRFAHCRTKQRPRQDIVEVTAMTTHNQVLRFTRLLSTTHSNPQQCRHKRPIKGSRPSPTICYLSTLHPLGIPVCEALSLPVPVPVRRMICTCPCRLHRHPQPTSRLQVARVHQQGVVQGELVWPFPFPLRKHRGGDNALRRMLVLAPVISNPTRARQWIPQIPRLSIMLEMVSGSSSWITLVLLSQTLAIRPPSPSSDRVTGWGHLGSPCTVYSFSPVVVATRGSIAATVDM